MATKRGSGKIWHAHGCPECFTYFEDTCDERDAQLVCADCRTGQPVRMQITKNNRRPKDCCRDDCRPVTKEELNLYILQRSIEWFICGVCRRTFPIRKPSRQWPAPTNNKE